MNDETKTNGQAATTADRAASRRAASARTNEQRPPFTFRWASRRILADMKRLAKRHNRTVGGEINAVCEAAVAAAKTEGGAA